MARLAGKRTGSGPAPRTGAAVAAGPTGIGSRLKVTEALPTLKRCGERQLRAAAHESPQSQHAAETTKAARMTAEETAPRAEPRQGYEKATGAVQVVQVVDEPDGAAGSRPSAPSAPKTAPNRPALKSRTEPATQAPQATQRAGSKPPQPKHVCQKKWALLEDLQLVIHKANSKGATDLLCDYLGGGSFKQRHTDSNWSAARASLAWETGRWLCSRTCWRARPSTPRSRQRYMATQWKGGSQTSPRSLISRSLQGT